MRESLRTKLQNCEARFAELEAQSADPAIIQDRNRSKVLFRELGGLRDIITAYRKYGEVEASLEEAKEIVEGGGDPEFVELAQEEIPDLVAEMERLELEIETLLLEGEDEVGSRDAILEIRAGTGGEEAALFAKDLARIYERFCQRKGWKMKALEYSESDLGGFKEAVFSVSGDGVFRIMRFEMGGHRVQRIPVTDSQGRIQTSAATVAVLPEAEEVDVELDERDLEFQTTTSSGPGGQHVNKTQSAVRITHIPTGLVVFCQEERSQHKNKARALKLLRSRLFDLERQKVEDERAHQRKTQVGSGDRSQRVRTYNFPQNRVTDHRVPGKNFSLEKILDGDLDPLIEDLRLLDREERLRDL